jgi:hypothetical protein
MGEATYREYEEQENYLYSLSNQILTLEQSPLPMPPLPYLQSMTTLPRKIDDIYAVSIQAGMAYHEIENLVEWRMKTFSATEIDRWRHSIRWSIENSRSQLLSPTHRFYIAMYELASYLKTKPIKIPSGHYTETLTVERTQPDLNSDMVQELLDLQPHNAYVKSATWKGKIQTVVVDEAAAALLRSGGYELVDVRGSARNNAIHARILIHAADDFASF